MILEQIKENRNLKYFNKAKKCYKYTFYIFLYSIVASMLLRGFSSNYYADFIVGIPAIVAIIAAPVGLFNIIKSYTKKEDYHPRKMLFLIGLLFFTVMPLLVLTFDIIRFFV